MVSPIENRAILRGTIAGRALHQTLTDYDQLDLIVSGADDVPGYPNLLVSTIGTTIELTVRRELLGSAGPGDTLRCRARRTAGGAMCDPYPEPGALTVSPAVPDV